jgi:cytochrome bd-type quinol oxidase subunit 2
VFEVKGPIWFVLFAFTFASDATLFIATHRVADRPTSTLDERQQAVRNRAYRTAYLLVFNTIVLVVGGAMLLFFTGHEIASRWVSHPASHPAVLSGIGVATLQLASLLPTAIIAWTERDEPGDFD